MILCEDSRPFLGENTFRVKIALVKPRVFEKNKIAHNSLNNDFRAVLTPFLDIDIFLIFWDKIDFFRQNDQKMTKIDQKSDFSLGFEAIFGSKYIF